MTYFCIDPGLSYTGIAIADSNHLVQPLTTIRHSDSQNLLRKISSLILSHQPSQIIIGQPSSGLIHQLANEIKTNLKEKFPQPIILYPEDLSTKKATQKLFQTGASSYKRRAKIHSASAAIILQDYLSSFPQPY